MSSGSDLVHAKSVEVRRFIFSVMQSVFDQEVCWVLRGSGRTDRERSVGGKSKEELIFLEGKITGRRKKRYREYLVVMGSQALKELRRISKSFPGMRKDGGEKSP